MFYIKVKYSFILSLRNAWSDFCNETERAIRDVADSAIRKTRQEAQEDIRYGRYSVSSVKQWKEEQEHEIEKWRDEYLSELGFKKFRGNRLIAKLEDKRFYNSEPGEYIVNFEKEEIQYFYGDTMQFGMIGIYYEGNVESYSFRVEFNPPKVEFGNWIEC